ncbi:smoothelin-like protein 1 isoform X1 [Anguilla rostrata]|uniref:smoothelin-like protein 1 isoform X1 n=1 Tax=Anguilla rostrata TaxID=7938 RepID=UPI0030D2D99B
MGSSLGCVKRHREAGVNGAPPLSPKKRFRFRRKRKPRKQRSGSAGGGAGGRDLPHRGEEDSRKEVVAAVAGGDVRPKRGGLDSTPAAEVQSRPAELAPSPEGLHPGPESGKAKGPKVLVLSPEPSPAWRGVFCLPQGEGGGGGTTGSSGDAPDADAPDADQGSATPGGGRVCRVRERVQGVLQKPRILQAERGREDLHQEDQRQEDLHQEDLRQEDLHQEDFPARDSDRPAPTEEKRGVVHIREVGGKLCVVRTVYPRDFGSPVWGERGVEVRAEPPALARQTGNVLRVRVREKEEGLSELTDSSGADVWATPPDDLAALRAAPVHAGKAEKEASRNEAERSVAAGGLLSGNSPVPQDPLSSGYASDLPLTSPETGGATQADWGGLTSSSSEVLDTSAMESPLSPPEGPPRPSSQISEIYVSGESGDLTAKEKLLLWSQQAIEGYPGTRCVNFSSSWNDGRMFNVLLHRYRPDLIDMEVVGRQSNRDNLEQAFDIAESLGVTRLLDAEDVDVPSPDEKSVITYVSSIYDAFPKIPEGGEGIPVHEVDQRWAEYQARFPALLQWTRQHTLLMADKNFPQNPVELKALYNEYVHFKETEIPAKEMEKSRIEHLYKMLEVWMEFGRIKLPQGLHPNDLEEEWGKLILEMLEREKALRPAVERLELLLQMANKIQNAALDCEEKLTHAKNTVQAGVLNPENVDSVRCEQELGVYLQDCEGLIRQLQLDLQILRDEKYYQVEQLAFR